MQFDRTQYKWVKRPGEESDDPFRDFESVVDYVSSLQNGDQREHPTIVINDAAQAIATDLSEEEIVSAAHNSEDEISVDHSAMPGSHLQVNAANLQGPQHTPLGTPRLAAKTMPTPIRSALKNPVATMVTPIHADPGSATGKLRSVSFSDGRHSGRIRGLHPGQVEEESSKDDVSHSQSKRSIQPSFRTKRIVDMLDELDDESSSRTFISFVFAHFKAHIDCRRRRRSYTLQVLIPTTKLGWVAFEFLSQQSIRSVPAFEPDSLLFTTAQTSIVTTRSKCHLPDRMFFWCGP